MTGLGIIATFVGLISGLSNFNVTETGQVQQELANLMNSVSHAFTISALAIAIAMIFTFFEKLWVTNRYEQAEKICERIDSLFETTRGEDYLERLVTEAEKQTTQATQIKDSLVTELKQILEFQTSLQIKAQERLTGQMSGGVGKAIGDVLQGPMSEISEAVKVATTNQGDAVNELLGDVLSQFSQKMEDMFGDQLSGMSSLLQETSDAMKQAAEQFAQLASNMDSAGQQAVEGMTEKLTEAMNNMEVRQQTLNQQIGGFIGQIRQLVTDSQSESAQKLQESLGAIGEQVTDMVAALRQHADEAAQNQGQQQAQFETRTQQAVSTLSEQMEKLLAQSVITNQSLQETVVKLADTTQSNIDKMNQGAETLYIAATDFANAGNGVSDTLNISSCLVETMKVTANELTSASNATKEVLQDYSRTRDALITC